MFHCVCHSINLYNYSLFLHLIFVTFSLMKVTSLKKFSTLLTETEPYVLMFCSHWIGNDLVFSSNPRKGENRHCWVCPVPWDSRTVVALSVLTIASYLHTGKLLRYFLRWLVLMLGFYESEWTYFRPACFAYYPWLFIYLVLFYFITCFWLYELTIGALYMERFNHVSPTSTCSMMIGCLWKVRSYLEQEKQSIPGIYKKLTLPF